MLNQIILLELKHLINLAKNERKEIYMGERKKYIETNNWKKFIDGNKN